MLEFLEEKNVVLKDRLLQFKADVVHITDLSAKFNAINLQLQRQRPQFDTNKISYFRLPPPPKKKKKKKKLTLRKRNFVRKELRQFPILWILHKKNEIFDDSQAYCQHLDFSYKDFTGCFEDILSLEGDKRDRELNLVPPVYHF